MKLYIFFLIQIQIQLPRCDIMILATDFCQFVAPIYEILTNSCDSSSVLWLGVIDEVNVVVSSCFKYVIYRWFLSAIAFVCSFLCFVNSRLMSNFTRKTVRSGFCCYLCCTLVGILNTKVEQMKQIMQRCLKMDVISSKRIS